MQLPTEIASRMGKKSPEDAFINIAGALMREYHMSYREVRDLPIPMALALLKQLQEMNKEIERRSK